MKATVKHNKEIADKIYELSLSGEFKQDDFKPGRFLHIKCSDSLEPLLRRPMSICDVRDSEDELVILYRSEGRGTELLSKRKAEEEIDMLAPLGSQFPTDNAQAGQTAILVGGGIGVPPLYYLGRKLKDKGLNIISILGFNAGKDIFYAQEFSKLGETWITSIVGDFEKSPCSLDGVKSKQGLVTDALAECDWDLLYSCGPNAMLKAIQVVVPEGKEAYISMEERMGCGVGACLACVCQVSEDYSKLTGKNYARVCTEGPVFKLDQVIFK